jgi:hypothetical protein
VHRKQRHTAKKMFNRLRLEYNYQSSYSTVRNAVRDYDRQREQLVTGRH